MHQNSLWLNIWTKPRETIRRILESDPKKRIVLLAILNGLLAAITWLVTYWMRYPQEKGFSHPVVVILILILGLIGGLVNLYVGAFLYRVTGSWLRGKGSFRDVKCAVGWSNYPYLVSGLFGLISVLLINHPFIQFPFLFLKVATLVWAFVIFLKMLGESHRFSAWRALAAILIAFAIIFIIVVGISLIIGYLTSQPFAQNSRAIKIYNEIP